MDETQANDRNSRLSTIFSPATWLLERLRYAPKFLVMGIAFFLPVVYLGYLQYDVNNLQYQFNTKESVGVAYVKPASNLLFAINRYRIAVVASMAGGSSNRVNEERASVDAQLSKLGEFDARYGDDNPLTGLKTTQLFGQTRDAWSAIKTTNLTSIDDANTRIDALSGMVSKLILDNACNFSNLILDPDLDTYYMMDAFCVKLPLISETIADEAAMSLRGLKNEQLTSGERIDLAGLYRSMLSTGSDLIALNAEVIYKETKDAGVRPALQPFFDTTKSRLDVYGSAVRRNFLEQETLALSVNATSDGALTALESVHSLYDALAPQLDKLIMYRANSKYLEPRNFGLIAVIFAVLLLSYIFIALYLSVTRSIAKVRFAAEGMMAGKVTTVSLGTNDEIGDIGGSFNQISAALQESRQLKANVDKENESMQTGIFDLLQVVSRAADGELTVRARVNEGAIGNVADAFNEMMESLQRLVGQIALQLDDTLRSVDQMTGATREIAKGSTDQVNGFAEAQSLIARYAKELAEVSSIAKNASDAAKRTETSAKDGGTAVTDVIQGMEGLRVKVQGGAKKVKSLGDRSMEITTIVGTIARISEQTNMLALNAAIEAVRAGEHGHGFSIVADEVKKLAERTAAATQEIEKLVRTIQLETNESVEAIEQQTTVMEREVEVVGRAGQALSRIQQVSTETARIVDTINRVSEEQARAMKEVEERISDISNIARKSLISTNLTVDQLNVLRGKSDALSLNIRKFKVN